MESEAEGTPRPLPEQALRHVSIQLPKQKKRPVSTRASQHSAATRASRASLSSLRSTSYQVVPQDSKLLALEEALPSRQDLIKKKTKDYAAQWSRYAERPRRYNRMDPDPDPPTDDERPKYYVNIMEVEGEAHGGVVEGEKLKRLTQTASTVNRDRDGNVKKILTKEDWRKFWVDRLRKYVDAPSLTDKEIADTVDRGKQVYLRNREKDRLPHIDPDLPPCYYWGTGEVAKWAESLYLPGSIPLKEILLSSDINGRRLISLDANTLVKMGIYNLTSVKTVTKAVRGLLGLPAPNGLRAISRVVPLEKFLQMKIRTGTQVDKLTFKEFCEKEGIDYDSAKREKLRGYKGIPGTCRIVVKPGARENIRWYPVSAQKLSPASDDESLLGSSDDSTTDGPAGWYLEDVPTVEELCANVVVRNAVIPQILNEIVERVYAAVAADEEAKARQILADEIFRKYMAEVYSRFSVFEPDEQLKFITIIAEELVEDVLRAREVLEDIEGFQSRTVAEGMPEEDMENMQGAVGQYVRNIMPLVVSAALKQLDEKSSSLNVLSTTKLGMELELNRNVDEDKGGSDSDHSSISLVDIMPPDEFSDKTDDDERLSNGSVKVLYEGKDSVSATNSVYRF